MSQRRSKKRTPMIVIVAVAAAVGMLFSASFMWMSQHATASEATIAAASGASRELGGAQQGAPVHDVAKLVRTLQDKVASLEAAAAAAASSSLGRALPPPQMAPQVAPQTLVAPPQHHAALAHPLHSILHEPEHPAVSLTSAPPPHVPQPFVQQQQQQQQLQPPFAPPSPLLPPPQQQPPMGAATAVGLGGGGPDVWVEAKSFLKPLWDLKHKHNGDAVFGLMFGYGLIDYKRFVGSLRETGYTDDIVLATSHPTKGKVMRPGVEQYLKGHRVLCYPFQFQCKKKGQKRRNLLVTPAGCTMTDWYEGGDQRGPRPLALIRYEHYQTWIQLYSERSWFLILDTRDTIFQQNPFLPRLLDRSTHDLHLFQENRKVKWVGKCPFNSGWLACWGRDIPKRFSNNSVVCSGSTLGSKHGVVTYVNEMLKEMDSQKCHELRGTESDQGYHNYLYDMGRHQANGLNVKSWEQGTGVVNTIGAMNGFRVPAHMKGPLDTFWKARDEKGYILNWDGSLSPVVHQWDRFAKELIKWIDRNIAK